MPTPLPSRIRVVLPMLFVFLTLAASTGPAAAQIWTEQGDVGDRGCPTSQTRVGSPLVSGAGLYYLAVAGNDGRAQSGGGDIYR